MSILPTWCTPSCAYGRVAGEMSGWRQCSTPERMRLAKSHGAQLTREILDMAATTVSLDRERKKRCHAHRTHPHESGKWVPGDTGAKSRSRPGGTAAKDRLPSWGARDYGCCLPCRDSNPSQKTMQLSVSVSEILFLRGDVIKLHEESQDCAQEETNTAGNYSH
jgi:hypothetical protein